MDPGQRATSAKFAIRDRASQFTSSFDWPRDPATGTTRTTCSQGSGIFAGLSQAQAQTGMWAMLAAPLVISTGEVWVKPLVGDDWAVALFNTGTSPLTLQVTPDIAGMPSAVSYTWQDLWKHDTFRKGPHGTVTVIVPARSATLYRVSA
jgi:hypothetical protein